MRLYRRYKHLTERGKPLPQAVMAVVRELAGFLWAMLHRLWSDPVGPIHEYQTDSSSKPPVSKAAFKKQV